jgi:aminodeoxyfutalosine deaminase
VAVPKIELHVHLEGSIRPATLLDIARRNDERLPADTIEELTALYEFRDFKHFIEVWQLTTNCLRTVEDFRQVVVDYAAEASSLGAVYIEGIFSPGERILRAAVGWDEIFTGYTEGAAEALDRYGVTMRLTPDLWRSCPVDIAEECARVAVRYRDRGIVGLGVGGYEPAGPLAPFRRAVEIARDGGVAFVPHAGESAGPASIREALDLGAHRLRHGIRAVEDADLLAEIVERRIVLDVAPVSNLRTGVVPRIEEHPLPRLRAAGALCSISTDDPAMFNTDLAMDYEMAATLGVTAEQAFEAGLAGALCDEATKLKIIATSRKLSPNPAPTQQQP